MFYCPSGDYINGGITVTVEERCARIIRLAEKVKKETDECLVRQLMQEIHILSAEIR
jgi:hypothetical protein